MEIKLIIAGGRDFHDKVLLKASIDNLLELGNDQDVYSIVSGMAAGADRLGVEFARKYGVTLYEFPADWDKYGKAAGYRRNADMAVFSDQLLAFWDGKSRGTKHMIETIQKMAKPVTVINY